MFCYINKFRVGTKLCKELTFEVVVVVLLVTSAELDLGVVDSSLKTLTKYAAAVKQIILHPILVPNLSLKVCKPLSPCGL